MPLPEAGRRRDRRLDRVHELSGARVRLLPPPLRDCASDWTRVTLLAQSAKDRLEVAARGLVDELGRGGLRRRIHAHVERGVDRVGEAALGLVELHARDTEVEQDGVGTNAVRGELTQYRGELSAQE